jgi:hypothetical protein
MLMKAVFQSHGIYCKIRSNDGPNHKMTQGVAAGTLREEPTRFVPYINWAVAQDLGPWKLAELDGPWPVTITYMRAPAGEMMRPREVFHDLFISMRTVELWEKSIARRRRFIFRRGTIGFTCAGSAWHLGWSGLLEGVGFLFSDETLRRAFGDDADEVRWRLALSDHAPAIGFLGLEIANQVFGGFPGPGCLEARPSSPPGATRGALHRREFIDPVRGGRCLPGRRYFRRAYQPQLPG